MPLSEPARYVLSDTGRTYERIHGKWFLVLRKPRPWKFGAGC